ncbi:MAG: hypothetical protein NT067_01135 [Candidatus Diapherotrites archaeon]|nr:hypothetical protein [Candidatus Diapherotrites archaeon]
MENMVWVIFGALALLIGLGIFLQIVAGASPERKETVNGNAIRDFGQFCNSMCGSDIDSRFTKEIEIASGAVVSSDTNIICLEAAGQKKCAGCTCDVKDLSLNLNMPEILKMYESHRFKCVFERLAENTVSVKCYG